MSPSQDPRAARRVARAFGALTAAAFALIVLGALVRTHGAGLACPDWPLCFGALVPAFDFRIALEWGHRALAGSVALLFAATAYAVATRAELRAAAGGFVAAAAALLALQVVLGGLTVWLGLAPWTVTLHLLVGHAFCATLLLCSRRLAELPSAPGARVALRAPAAAAAGVVALCLAAQIALGGLVSSHYAGLACPAFPSCDGESFAPTLHGLVGLHVLHRLNALALLGALAAFAWLARGAGPTGRLAWSALRLALLQFAIGVANVLLRLPVEVTALHSALAAALVLLVALAIHEWVAASAESKHHLRAGARALEAA